MCCLSSPPDSTLKKYFFPAWYKTTSEACISYEFLSLLSFCECAIHMYMQLYLQHYCMYLCIQRSVFQCHLHALYLPVFCFWHWWEYTYFCMSLLLVIALHVYMYMTICLCNCQNCHNTFFMHVYHNSISFSRLQKLRVPPSPLYTHWLLVYRRIIRPLPSSSLHLAS